MQTHSALAVTLMLRAGLLSAGKLLRSFVNSGTHTHIKVCAPVLVRTLADVP